MAHGAPGRRKIHHYHPTSAYARTSTHVHVHVPGTSGPDLRDAPRLARVSASRDQVHPAAAHLGGVVRRKGEIQHTCLCARDVRDEQPQKARRERPSSPPRSRSATFRQARRASSVVSHLEGRRAKRRQLQQPHGWLVVIRRIWVRHNTGWHVTTNVVWLASIGGCAFSQQPLLHTIPSVSRAWVVGLKLAPNPARAYRRSQGAEHAFDLGGWASRHFTEVPTR